MYEALVERLLLDGNELSRLDCLSSSLLLVCELRDHIERNVGGESRGVPSLELGDLVAISQVVLRTRAIPGEGRRRQHFHLHLPAGGGGGRHRGGLSSLGRVGGGVSWGRYRCSSAHQGGVVGSLDGRKREE